MDEHLLRFDKKKTLVFIDCETENLCLNSCHNLAWQIAMIKSVGGKKVAEKNFYIKWDRELNISKEAARITRFNVKKYKDDAVDFRQVFPTIKDWLDDADHIVGHNVLGFDIYVIRGLYKKVGEDCTHLLKKIVDTYCIAKGIEMGMHYDPKTSLIEYQYRMMHKRKRGLKTGLGTLGKILKIDHDYTKLHDAIVDLELNLKVWNHYKYQIEI